MSAARIPHFALLALCSLPSAGCCSLAEYLCGPDDSRWVTVSFVDPAAAQATLCEALRRSNPEVLYRCLGEDFRRDNGLGGELEWNYFWGRLKETAPGIHVMGNARLTGPEPAGPDRVRYVMERSGYRIEVVWRRVAYWQVEWDSEFGADAAGEFVPSLDEPLVRVDTDDSGGQRVEAQFEFHSFGSEDLTTRSIRRATVGHEWKVLDLRQLPEE